MHVDTLRMWHTPRRPCAVIRPTAQDRWDVVVDEVLEERSI